MKKDIIVETCEKIYNELTAQGIEVLFDDRLDASAGVKFNDADLLGMPLQVVVGERNLKENSVEIKVRRTDEREMVTLDNLNEKVKELLKKLNE